MRKQRVERLRGSVRSVTIVYGVVKGDAVSVLVRGEVEGVGKVVEGAAEGVREIGGASQSVQGVVCVPVCSEAEGEHSTGERAGERAGRAGRAGQGRAGVPTATLPRAPYPSALVLRCWLASGCPRVAPNQPTNSHTHAAGTPFHAAPAPTACLHVRCPACERTKSRLRLRLRLSASLFWPWCLCCCFRLLIQQSHCSDSGSEELLLRPPATLSMLLRQRRRVLRAGGRFPGPPRGREPMARCMKADRGTHAKVQGPSTIGA